MRDLAAPPTIQISLTPTKEPRDRAALWYLLAMAAIAGTFLTVFGVAGYVLLGLSTI